MTENLLCQFLGEHTYDVRNSKNGRWIDQKCAPDEVSFVAGCVIEYINANSSLSFHNKDIWMSPFARQMVQGYFSKPDPTKVTATDEYNKFFRQPLKMLSAAGILSESIPFGNQILFRVENKAALKFVAESDWNAYLFLCHYIEKTLKDSDLWDYFASFFDAQNDHYYVCAKRAFVDFCFGYTPIKNEAEASRIFAKVLNPLAYRYRKCGTVGGRMSSHKITFCDLKYNRENFRDTGNKAKDQTRQEAAGMGGSPIQSKWTNYKAAKAKNDVSGYNNIVNAGLSEVVSINSSGQATQMHHMFMQSQYPNICDFRENIVALTPTQHLTMAHPQNNTSKVDPDFQRVCLLAKLKSVEHNLNHGVGPSGFYDFGRLLEVLDTGFEVDVFSDIPTGDFTTVQQTVDAQY